MTDKRQKKQRQSLIRQCSPPKTKKLDHSSITYLFSDLTSEELNRALAGIKGKKSKGMMGHVKKVFKFLDEKRREIFLTRLNKEVKEEKLKDEKKPESTELSSSKCSAFLHLLAFVVLLLDTCMFHADSAIHALPRREKLKAE